MVSSKAPRYRSSSTVTSPPPSPLLASCEYPLSAGLSISSRKLTASPQFYEIYRLRQVKGISLIFLCVDITGGTLSAFALFFREELDVVALVCLISHLALLWFLFLR
jgi:hypothetical protein